MRPFTTKRLQPAYEIPETGLTTLKKDIAEKHASTGWTVNEREVRIQTLTDICNQYVSGEIHFLKIDVEGFELEVIRGMNKALADASLGMIFHSKYNFELCEKYYGIGWRLPSRHICQLKAVGVRISEEEQLRLREKLHIPEGALVVSSFGFLHPTKLNELLVQAWEKIKNNLADNGKKACLAFVGERCGIQPALEKYVNNDDSIRITGFVADEVYDDYIRCTDIAVQLRAKSRGETSRAVLDCLAYGIPTIVNAYAGFNDYPDNVVIKLSSMPSPEEVANAVLALAVSSEERNAIGASARAYIKETHDPAVVGKMYAEFIHEIIQKNPLTKERFLGATADAIRGEHFEKTKLWQIAQAYHRNFQFPYHIHRIWMFVDNSAWKRFSKIQSYQMLETTEAEICHVCWQNNEVHRIRDDGSIAERQTFSPGDTVLLSHSILDNLLLGMAVGYCTNIYLYVEQSIDDSVIPDVLRPIIMGVVSDRADIAEKGMAASFSLYSLNRFFDREYWKKGQVDQVDEMGSSFDRATDKAEKLLSDGMRLVFTEGLDADCVSRPRRQRIESDLFFSLKHGIKQNILKPGYYWLSGVSPVLAEKIRRGVARIFNI